jgi:hydrogenase maturation protease
MTTRVLVAGIGNVFLGDDGFGVEVAWKLAGRPLPEGVVVTDIGVRALHLAFELLDRPAALIVVDALDRGEAPGSLVVIEPEIRAGSPSAGVPDAHSMSLDTVVAAVRGMGGEVPPLLLVGCQPAFIGERMGLSPIVQRAVPQAVALVERTIARLLTGLSNGPPGDAPGPTTEETAHVQRKQSDSPQT